MLTNISKMPRGACLIPNYFTLLSRKLSKLAKDLRIKDPALLRIFQQSQFRDSKDNPPSAVMKTFVALLALFAAANGKLIRNQIHL